VNNLSGSSPQNGLDAERRSWYTKLQMILPVQYGCHIRSWHDRHSVVTPLWLSWISHNAPIIPTWKRRAKDPVRKLNAKRKLEVFRFATKRDPFNNRKVIDPFKPFARIASMCSPEGRNVMGWTGSEAGAWTPCKNRRYWSSWFKIWSDCADFEKNEGRQALWHSQNQNLE